MDIEELRSKLEREKKIKGFDPKSSSMFKEILTVIDKLGEIKTALEKEPEEREENEYYDEINSVHDAVVELKDVLSGKEMNVNIPLDEFLTNLIAKLSVSFTKIEQSIKAIPKVEIPSTISLEERQVDDIIDSIDDIKIPEFPTKEIGKMFDSLSKSMPKFEFEFDYSKFDDVIKAIKKIKIGGTTVTNSGPSRVGINNGDGSKIDPATSGNQTDGSQKTQLVDSAGNVVDAEADHAGKYHLAVTVNQDVNADPNNTSSDNLNAGATFTGTATSTLGVVGLQWSLYTTQNCTVYVDESPDGTNWDISYSFNYLASQGGRGETVQATQAYWRIRVTNIGAIATTTFRLQGVLCPVAVPLPSSLSETGRLKVQNENQFIEIPRGRINGYSVVNKFGANSNVDAGATEEIWDGNRVYVFPTTASITHIRTEADTAAMDGMVVEIQGLDTNYDLVVQNATIDAGTSTATEVELGTPLRRVFRMKVLSSVVTTNAIWVGATGMSAATANGIIQAGNNQTLMAIYTVPAGKTGYMTQWRATVNPATGKDPTSMPIKMWARDNANNYAKQLKDIQGLIVGTLRVPYEPYYKFTEKTDIYFTASPVGKAADVSVGFDLILVDNQ